MLEGDTAISIQEDTHGIAGAWRSMLVHRTGGVEVLVRRGGGSWVKVAHSCWTWELMPENGYPEILVPESRRECGYRRTSLHL